MVGHVRWLVDALVVETVLAGAILAETTLVCVDADPFADAGAGNVFGLEITELLHGRRAHLDEDDMQRTGNLHSCKASVTVKIEPRSLTSPCVLIIGTR